MWIRFIKATSQTKVGDVVDVSYQAAKAFEKAGEAAMCTGPDGVSFNEATPEAVKLTLDNEKAKGVKI